MPRKSGGVEIGVMAGLLAVLAVCASRPEPMRGPKSVPEGVDYIMAVQCGGLLSPTIGSGERAAAHNHDGETGRRDSEASRQDFIVEIGQGTSIGRTMRLEAAYRSSSNVCKSRADLPDCISIGG